jgi:hypothetical protein
LIAESNCGISLREIAPFPSAARFIFESGDRVFFRGACLRIADLRFASGPTLFQGVKRHNAYAPVKLNLPSFSYLSKTKKSRSVSTAALDMTQLAV